MVNAHLYVGTPKSCEDNECDQEKETCEELVNTNDNMKVAHCVPTSEFICYVYI